MFFCGVFSLLSASPDILSTPGVNASDQQVGIDGSGNTVASWIESGQIKSRTKLVDQDWGAIVSLSSSGVSSMKMVVDSFGNATAVWLESNVVKTSTMALSAAWGSASSLSSSNSSSPDIAVDSSGNMVAVWARGGDIETSTKLFGGAWSSVDVITSTLADSPKVAIGDNGTVMAIWYGMPNTLYEIYTSGTTIGGSWSAQTSISDTSHHAVNPTLSVDVNGNTLAVWYSYDQTGSTFSNVLVQSASKLLNQAWSPLETLSEKGLYDPQNLSICISSDDNSDLIVTWLNSYDGLTLELGASIYLNDGLANTSLLDFSIYTGSLDCKTCSVGEGDVLVVYPYYDADNDCLKIQCIHSDLDELVLNSWSSAMIISEGDINGNPKVDLVRVGNYLRSAVLWQNYNETYVAIHGVVNKMPDLQPPTNLNVVQSQKDLGFQTDFYNTLTWDATTSAGVTQYAIFRDDIYVATIENSVLQFIDYHRISSNTVTYKIASISGRVLSRRASVEFTP